MPAVDSAEWELPRLRASFIFQVSNATSVDLALTAHIIIRTITSIFLPTTNQHLGVSSDRPR